MLTEKVCCRREPVVTDGKECERGQSDGDEGEGGGSVCSRDSTLLPKEKKTESHRSKP